ncbi:replication-associated recombination protein A [Hahella ganghwensis]|uniref:replication-associated recombination protein A n=1 Tax=Hahella ganghwensis TaxID=286420 RepID=UPI0003741EF3|nr:replication-associated recombination protein A [Hahella ganghwensis]
MNLNLFEAEGGGREYAPLAARLRPQTVADYVGQEHLLGPDRPLRKALERDNIHSMILWGPPGVGKTSLAKLIAATTGAEFLTMSAVLHGVKDIREFGELAKKHRQAGKRTIVFVDEVHRFNKAQQDAFLPYVEDGDFVFVGATTENPSFELNNALLSRARVYLLKSLSIDDLTGLMRKALTDAEKGLGEVEWDISDELLHKVAMVADGDARQALNLIETMSDLAEVLNNKGTLTENMLAEVTQMSLKRFDKGGDVFYDQISALHKSVRGSNPDASLYWFARMLDGGCDPLYIARRVVRMASEEIGNADPRALPLALAAWDVQERLGSPEGELAIAQAITYLAAAPKSNAVYKAYNQARSFVKDSPDYPVPMHLRNAPTSLMKELGYGHEYRYAHDEPEAYAAGENYFPDQCEPVTLYEPVPRGLELKIGEKLKRLKVLDEEALARAGGTPESSK